MRIISLVPVGRVERGHLESLAQGLASRLRVACWIRPDGLNGEFAYNPVRGQYHSTEILKRLLQDSACGKLANPGSDRRRPLHPHPDLRFWRSPIGRHRRPGFHSSSAPGVLWHAQGPRAAPRAPLEGGPPRIGPHFWASALPGLPLRDERLAFCGENRFEAGRFLRGLHGRGRARVREGVQPRLLMKAATPAKGGARL